jgi:hypothetical protein
MTTEEDTDQTYGADDGLGVWFPSMGEFTPLNRTIPASTTVRDWDRTLDELWEAPASPDEATLRSGVAHGRRIGQSRSKTAAPAAPRDHGSALNTAESDPMAQLAHSARTRTKRLRRNRRLVKAAALTATGVVVVGAVLIAVQAIGAKPIQASADVSPPAAPQQSQPWCPVVNEGARISGAGPGDTTTGPGQILWLEYQMYVQRNADAARQVLAPSAAAAPIEETRAAISAIPTGTEHCVHMVALAADRFSVKVEERLGSGASQTWDLLVTIAIQPDGRSLIAAIMPATGER